MCPTPDPGRKRMPLVSRVPRNTCDFCGNQGHWQKDCPEFLRTRGAAPQLLATALPLLLQPPVRCQPSKSSTNRPVVATPRHFHPGEFCALYIPLPSAVITTLAAMTDPRFSSTVEDASATAVVADRKSIRVRMPSFETARTRTLASTAVRAETGIPASALSRSVCLSAETSTAATSKPAGRGVLVKLHSDLSRSSELNKRSAASNPLSLPVGLRAGPSFSRPRSGRRVRSHSEPAFIRYRSTDREHRYGLRDCRQPSRAHSR